MRSASWLRPIAWYKRASSREASASLSTEPAGAARARLIEQREGPLGLVTRLVEPLARHVHFAVVDQTQGLQVHVAHALGEGAALPEIAVRGFEPAPVGAHHPEIVVGDGTAMLVPAVAVRRERALVAGQRLVQLSLDVGDDAEVLLP